MLDSFAKLKATYSLDMLSRNTLIFNNLLWDGCEIKLLQWERQNIKIAATSILSYLRSSVMLRNHFRAKELCS
jgi:hypothetical protein